MKDIFSDNYVKAGCLYFKLTETPIPVVSVYVQGGAGTVDSVLQTGTTDIPALLVRGSGKVICYLMLSFFNTILLTVRT